MDHIFPLLTYNAIIYSISSLSTSITSTQNIFNFIIQHKDNDYVVFQHQLEATDLYNKLNIVSALIKDILRKHCNDKNLSDKAIEDILHPTIELENNDDYNMINLIKKTSINLEVPEPVKLALLSCLEIIIKINNVLEKIHTKILDHQKSYLKNFIKISICFEINKIILYTELLNSRLHILFEVLKIYSNIIIA